MNEEEKMAYLLRLRYLNSLELAYAAIFGDEEDDEFEDEDIDEEFDF